MVKITCAVLIVINATIVATSAQDRPARPERPAAPAPVAPPAPFAPLPPLPDEGRQSWTLSMGTGRTRLHVEARGHVELTDDERDIKSVSPNGSFEITSKGWLSLFGQQYLVRGNADGTTTRRLTIGGAERSIDAEARAWIADTIRRLVRNGFGAEARVARIFAQQGPTGVLDEISRLDNDFSRARCLNWLWKQPRLDRPTAERALKQAGREIGSSFELARVLVAFAEALPLDDTIEPTFVETVNAIGADFERAQVLMTLLASERPTPSAIKVVLGSTPRIGSDFEKARVLGRLAQKKDLGADTLLTLIRATASIGSDFERSRVLLQIVAMQPIDVATRQALLDVTARIGSDYERGHVMSAMLREGVLR
jgi:hypothetical protein